MVLVNPNENEQDEIIGDILGEKVTSTSYSPISEKTLNPGESVTLLINGYCMNLDKENPSEGTEFTLSNTSSKTDVEQISGFIGHLEDISFPEHYTENQKIVVTQIALWASQPENENMTRADYEKRGYTLEDDDIAIIEDIIGAELFPEISTENEEKQAGKTVKLDNRIIIVVIIVIAILAGVILPKLTGGQEPKKPAHVLEDYENRIIRFIEGSQRLRDNYKKFLQLKEEVEKKKRENQKLTPEEEKVDAVDHLVKLRRWLRERKKRGKPGTGSAFVMIASADLFCNKKWKGSDPETPYERFKKWVIMEVHEQSHYESKKKKAEELGLDLKKMEKWKKLVDRQREGDPNLHQDRGGQARSHHPDPKIRAEENDILNYGYGRESWAWREYKKWYYDPVRSAKEEVHEYNEQIEALKDWRNWEDTGQK
jgi:hypothetical protein